ncbi:ABC transporter substrate-binding protein [Vibrio aquaticus]|uniref:ABC transporter substrate-binding protein n=1 Tax=Vibrio aquaticus TaxID=2496559 RepID=A0A432CV23_9VIBR|nr:ABC transporter substrate-binding protein [Vibrio aquaticus]RTZ15555.1 ABC transporter substrate-binding protein [Vibrio aquaticus]
MLLTRVMFYAALALQTFSANAAYQVTVNQFVRHPALDMAYQGIIEGLRQEGFIENETVTFDYAVAQADMGTSLQIARQQVALNPDVMVALSTPSAQTTASVNKRIPMVFSAVSSPRHAGVHLQGNITGVSALSPIKEQIQLTREVFPTATRIGVLYNPGEDNSRYIVDLLEQSAEKHQFTLIKRSVTSSTQVSLATKSLIEDVDLIYLPTDNTVASALPVIIKIAQAQSVPTIGGTIDYVNQGALMALGFDFFDNGVQAGHLVAQILSGAKPESLPIQPTKGRELHINSSQLERLNVELPKAVQDRITKLH